MSENEISLNQKIAELINWKANVLARYRGNGSRLNLTDQATDEQKALMAGLRYKQPKDSNSRMAFDTLDLDPSYDGNSNLDFSELAYSNLDEFIEDINIENDSKKSTDYKLENHDIDKHGENDRKTAHLHYMENSARYAVKYGIGNCQELSNLGLCLGIESEFFAKYGLESFDNVRIEQVHLPKEHGDHVFLVIGRADGSDLNDMSTWGDDAVICDPWANFVTPVTSKKKLDENSEGVFNYIKADTSHLVQDYETTIGAGHSDKFIKKDRNQFHCIQKNIDAVSLSEVANIQDNNIRYIAIDELIKSGVSLDKITVYDYCSKCNGVDKASDLLKATLRISEFQNAIQDYLDNYQSGNSFRLFHGSEGKQRAKFYKNLLESDCDISLKLSAMMGCLLGGNGPTLVGCIMSQTSYRNDKAGRQAFARELKVLLQGHLGKSLNYQPDGKRDTDRKFFRKTVDPLLACADKGRWKFSECDVKKYEAIGEEIAKNNVDGIKELHSNLLEPDVAKEDQLALIS